MSVAIDAKYALLLSSRLTRFSKQRSDHFLLACPLCGDNPKKRGKAGNLFRPKGSDGLMFHCYRCGESLWMRDFLQRVDPGLADEYRKETKAEWFDTYIRPSRTEEPQAPPFQPCPLTVLQGLPSIQSLPDQHPARAYILGRQIPASFHDVLFWTEDFAALAQKVRPDGRYDGLISEPRLVIPFLDENHQVMALQGRSLNPGAAVRYMTVKVHEDAPKIYGLHRRRDHSAPTYLTEGPFDSMFLPNALAAGGADLTRSLLPDQTVIVFDNEPRKRQTVDKMLKAANDGFAVCVWPEYIEAKDINEMILQGRTQATIRQIIDESTFRGRTAIRRINDWKRVTSYTGRI
jgi:hypothetical protein